MKTFITVIVDALALVFVCCAAYISLSGLLHLQDFPGCPWYAVALAACLCAILLCSSVVFLATFIKYWIIDTRRHKRRQKAESCTAAGLPAATPASKDMPGRALACDELERAAAEVVRASTKLGILIYNIQVCGLPEDSARRDALQLVHELNEAGEAYKRAAEAAGHRKETQGVRVFAANTPWLDTVKGARNNVRERLRVLNIDIDVLK